VTRVVLFNGNYGQHMAIWPASKRPAATSS
jgi:hypothetical protein